VWTLACSDSPAPDPVPTDVSVYVAGTVRDQDGAPVPLLTVVWEAWPAPDSADEAVVQDLSVRYFTTTDEFGRFATQVGYYSIAELDSIHVGTHPHECWGLGADTVRQTALAITRSARDTVLQAELTVPLTAARARLEVGPACAVMVSPDVPDLQHNLAIWIDEITDSVRGRWRLNFHHTRGDDYGQFSGAREGGSVRLDLRNEVQWDTETPAGLCTGYSLELPLEAGDTFGTGAIASEACLSGLSEPLSLRFVAGEWLPWAFDE
jgi:hypothetical protein